MTSIDKDSELHTYKLDSDGKKIIVFLDENRFKKKERALRRYFMGAYKYWIFEAVPKLKQTNKRDGKYELKLPVGYKFTKVYGDVKVLFSVKDDTVILEDIVPNDILLEMFSKDLPTYKGVPYLEAKDRFKIDLVEEINK